LRDISCNHIIPITKSGALFHSRSAESPNRFTSTYEILVWIDGREYTPSGKHNL